MAGRSTLPSFLKREFVTPDLEGFLPTPIHTRKDYFREYHSKHKEKILTQKRQYHLENRERILEYKRQRYLAKKALQADNEEFSLEVTELQDSTQEEEIQTKQERRKEYKKLYRLQNKERIKEYNREYQANAASKERRKINSQKKRGM
jgi:predicted metal-dependent hydrolase